MRKPIAIASTNDNYNFVRIVVLCDDGTVWSRALSDGTTEEWLRVPDVPQTDEEAAS